MFNTMKRKMFFRLTAICLVVVSALIACTKDYGSDITALQEEVKGLSKQVADLQKSIDDGCVITAVTPVAGGTQVTLSNGKEPFIVTNGKDGNDGKDGTVWKIDDATGNWFYDNGDGTGFHDSGKPSRGAIGPQGPQGVGVAGAVLNDDYTLTISFTEGDPVTVGPIRGEQGLQGDPGVGIAGTKLNDDYTLTVTFTDGTTWTSESIRGEQGPKGDDGDYYYPCVDKTSKNYKHWIKVNGVTGEEEPQEALWLSDDVVTAVWENDKLTFHNVEGAPDGVISISTAVGLNSLAVLPELWDSTMGLPMAKVYAIYPSNKEFSHIVLGDLWNKLFMFNGANEAIGEWGDDKFYDRNIWSFGGLQGFATMLWSSYIGSRQKITNNLSYPGYVAAFDVYSDSFMRSSEWNEALLGVDPENYGWGGGGSGTHWEQSYQALKETFENVLLPNLSARLEEVSNDFTQASWSRQIPVSAVNLKYRVNPAGADLSGYQFNMIDRTVKAYTKADGDNRAVSVVMDEEPVLANPDQLDVTAYIDYYKLWSNMPIEWFFKLWGTKVVHSYNLYNWKNGYPSASGSLQPNNGMRDWLPETIGSDVPNTGVGYGAELRDLQRWMEDQGLTYQTIIALEASKDGEGEGAIVSDYASVKMEYVQPYWTAFDHHDPCRPVAKWGVPHNLYNWWLGVMNFRSTGRAYENDLMKVSEAYDVAAHMRFADPYYGDLKKLGFDVRIDYYFFSPDSNPESHTATDANGNVNLGTGAQTYDEDGNPTGGVYGGVTQGVGDAYKYVKVDPKTGIVTVNKEAEGYSLDKVLAKYIFITADASIYNHATGTWYNSGNAGQATGNAMLWDGVTEWGGVAGLMFDEYAAQYCLQIVPDDNTAVEVVYDLGDIDYMTLSVDKVAPAQIALDALHMDLSGFGNAYQSAPTVLGASPAGYTGAYQAGNADMFAVTLSPAVALGEGQIKYCFTPVDTDIYPVLTYIIKWNITIDWDDLEPVLNPNYILYEDPYAENKVLRPTIIEPDPEGLYDARRGDDLRADFPYADSIIVVKGKTIDDTNNWVPQSSIREHILDYGRYLADDTHISNLSMSINYPYSVQPTTSAHIFAEGDLYKAQEIALDTPFAKGEKYRDYVVEMNVTLANGSSNMVKAYIVRFVCPFILVADPIVLHTHRTEWCTDRADFAIYETDSYGEPTDVVLAEWWTSDNAVHMHSDAANHYGNLFAGMETPKFEWETDPENTELDSKDSFGGNLIHTEATGRFYWRNNGNDLQVDKHTQYRASMLIPKIADLSGYGDITVLSTANSAKEHVGSNGHTSGSTAPTPSSDAHETVLIVWD